MRDKGICLLDRQGKRFNWTPFCYENFNNNVCVIGKDCTTKNIFMREMLMSTLNCGGRVFVFDYDGSYKHLCLSCNGSLFAFNKSSNLCINPFSTLVDDEEDRPLEFMHLEDLLTSMICEGGEHHKFDGVLSRAIEKTWGTYKEKTTMTKIAETLLSICYPHAYGRELAKKLTPYAKDGEYAGFFEGQCNLDLNNPMVVFDLSGLSKYPKLQSIVFQALMIQVSSHVFYGDDRPPFQVMINDASFSSVKHNMSCLIRTFSRRTRKHGGSLVVEVGDVRDYRINPALGTAFLYAGWEVYFQPEAIQLLKPPEFDLLSDDEESLAKSIREGEIYIKGRKTYVVGRLQAEGVESGVKK